MNARDPSNFDQNELTRLRKSIDRAFNAGRISADEHERQVAKIEQRVSHQRAQNVAVFRPRETLFVVIVLGAMGLPLGGFLLHCTSPLWRREPPEEYWKRRVISLGESVRCLEYDIKNMRLERVKESFVGEIERAQHANDMRAEGADSNSIENSVADLRAVSKAMLEVLDDQIEVAEQELRQMKQELENARSQLSKHSRDGNSPP